MSKYIAIYAGTGSALILIWFLFAFVPMQEERRLAHAEAAELATQLDDFTSTAKRIPEFLSATSLLKESRTDLQSRLYAKEDILSLLDRLDDLARKEHLRITNITPTVQELLDLNRKIYDPMEPDFLNLSLELKGSFVDFGKFVVVLEKEPFFRGTNECQIYRTDESINSTNSRIGFKALLGHIEDPAAGGPDE